MILIPPNLPRPSSTHDLRVAAGRFLEMPLAVININWAAVLFYSFFLAYGYFGAMTPKYDAFIDNLVSSVIALGLLTLIGALFGLLAWKTSERYRDSVLIRGKDFAVFASYVAILFIFSFDRLQFSLFSDELSYSKSSHGHSIRIALLVARSTNALDNIPFHYLVQLISLALLLSLIACFALSARIGWKYRIAVFSVAFVLGRLAITSMGGNGSIHPPLSLVPPFVFGAIAGISDYSFKASSFFSLCLLMWASQRMTRRIFSFRTSYLLSLAIGTIPLVWYLGTVVEQSLWTSICFLTVLVDMITSKTVNYSRLMTFVALATLFRQPSFLAIVPIMLLLGIEMLQRRERIAEIAQTLHFLAPTLLFVPFLARSLILGTPSTESLSNASIMLDRVLVAINANTVWISIVNSVSYWWIGFLPFAFIPLCGKTTARNAAFLLFSAITIFAYYSIDPGFLGFAKYQAEYVIPFAVAGMLFIAIWLSTFSLGRPALPFLIAILIVLNVFGFLRMPQVNKPVDALVEALWADGRQFNPGYAFLPAYPYNFHDAYEAIKETHLSEFSYNMGVTYGILPEIINGYSTSAIRSVDDTVKRQAYLMRASSIEGTKANTARIGDNVDVIDSDKHIKVVLIGFAIAKRQLIDGLKAKSWGVAGEYRNDQYGSTVVVMRRLVPNGVVFDAAD